MSKYVWQGKTQVKGTTRGKERGGLSVSILKLYFAACYLAWMKECVLLRNRMPLELGHDLRFGWHDKAK